MDLITESILTIIDRDLRKLEDEINLYPTEESLWTTSGAIKNPGGNLCLHLCGNLQHYIGAVLGGSGYVRNREHEFAARNIPRELLIQEINKTKTAVRSALEKLEPDCAGKGISRAGIQLFNDHWLFSHASGSPPGLSSWAGKLPSAAPLKSVLHSGKPLLNLPPRYEKSRFLYAGMQAQLL